MIESGPNKSAMTGDHSNHSRSLCVRLAAAGACIAALLAVAGLSGCDSMNTKAAEESGSIFGLLLPPSPADAARWSQDPYDADRRFRGTNLLANATFGGEDVYVKMYAMKLGAPPADKPDSDPGVRGVAARALGMHGDPASADLILPLLKESNRLVRLEAIRALQRIHNPKAVDALLVAVDYKQEFDQDVRSEAAIALGQYFQRRVLQVLVGALDDDYLAVTTNARRSLEVLTGQDFGENQPVWLDWIQKTDDVFAGRKPYLYPAFFRDPYWFEYLPFTGSAPNEISGTPVGMLPDGRTDLTMSRVRSIGADGTSGSFVPPVTAAATSAPSPSPVPAPATAVAPTAAAAAVTQPTPEPAPPVRQPDPAPPIAAKPAPVPPSAQPAPLPPAPPPPAVKPPSRFVPGRPIDPTPPAPPAPPATPN